MKVATKNRPEQYARNSFMIDSRHLTLGQYCKAANSCIEDKTQTTSLAKLTKRLKDTSRDARSDDDEASVSSATSIIASAPACGKP